ncbi:cycB (nucleomorph) [Hemiselmis andersenii]|uniref:CycB n=2 Tax=Hemiselmis andersenii TaxID=464988 RepID=A9BLB3_HEMAN|nr:cycB [Hemiselmis andersenii]ABW98296.1 cycB [Hemiselmis andersenii]
MKICNIFDVIKYSYKSKKMSLLNFNDFFEFKIQKRSFFFPNLNFYKNLDNWNFFSVFYYIDHSEENKFWFLIKQNFFYNIKSLDFEKGDPLANIDSFSFHILNMKNLEEKFLANSNYMKYQHDINKKMRIILVDWLIDVHSKFKLALKTLYLTINIFDRFLSKKNITRTKLQLLGITSMLMASKYEEIYAPETKDFVYISDNAYTKEDIFKMETFICSVLKFEFSYPSFVGFLVYFLKKINAKKDTVYLSMYISELTIIELSLLKYPPSVIAISAIVLARKFFWKLNESIFNLKILIPKINFLDKKFIPSECYSLLKSLLILNQNERKKIGSIRKKYSVEKFGKISHSKFSIILSNDFC